MGNIQTTQNLNKTGVINKNGSFSVKTEEEIGKMIAKELEKDFEMEKGIMDLGKKLYMEYSQFLLNPNFCNSISVVLAKNLETLPIQTLKDHQKKLEEEGARLVVQYKPLQPNETFIIPELQKSLENPLLNQKVDQEIEFKNIKMMLPKIEYIQKRILDILEYQSKKAQGFQKQTAVQEGGKKKRKRSKQSPNSEKKNSVDNSLIEELEKLKEEVNNKKENNDENMNVNNNRNDEEDDENENVNENNNGNNENNENEENNEEDENEDIENNNLNEENIFKNKKNNQKNNNQENNELNQEVALNSQEPNKISGIEKIVSNQEKNGKTFENKGDLREIEVEILRNKNRPFKQNKEEEITMEEIRNGNKKNNKTNKNQIEKKEEKKEDKKEEEVKEEEKLEKKNENNEEEEENEEGKVKPMTKAEICKRIAKHYTMRLNIISAILSTVPSINWQTKKSEGGFCSRRISSVRQGHFCLPPSADLEKAGENDEDRLKQIMRYMNYLDESSCDSAGGIYRKLDRDELNSLLYSNHHFNKLYLKYGVKLQEEYEKSLEQLKGLLYLLENSPLSNEKLNELARNTKLIINDMYTGCQLNYLLALLIFIDADLRVSTEAYQEKERRRAELISTL